MAPAPSPALSPFSDFTSSRCHRASDQRQLRYSDAKAPPPPSPPPCPRGKVYRRLPEHHELSASQRLCSPSWSSIQHPPLLKSQAAAMKRISVPALPARDLAIDSQRRLSMLYSNTVKAGLRQTSGAGLGSFLRIL